MNAWCSWQSAVEMKLVSGVAAAAVGAATPTIVTAACAAISAIQRRCRLSVPVIPLSPSINRYDDRHTRFRQYYDARQSQAVTEQPPPRDRMFRSAALLMRRRGVEGASFSEVLE